MKRLRERQSDFLILAEPVNKWCDFDGVNLMEKIYDANRMGAIIQVYISMAMTEHHKKPYDKILERSIFSGYEIFIKYLDMKKYINKIEKKILDQFIEFIKEQLDIKQPIFIFLDTPVSKCSDRWTNRVDQDNFFVDFELLSGIQELTEQWKNKLSSENRKYYEISGEGSPEEICANIEFIIEFERLNQIRL